MRWTVHSEKPLYEDEWPAIRLADVELPDGRHLERYHHRRPAVSAHPAGTPQLSTRPER